MIECLSQLARYRFTFCMVAFLIAAGIYGRTHIGPLDSAVQQQSGHSAHLLWRGELHRLFTSLLFTAGGWRFYSSLAMVLGVLTILLVRARWTSYYLPNGGQTMSADIAHLIAFPLGLILSRFVESQP